MRSSFLKNAAILTATSLLLRLLGMLFRIYMSNAVGAEGMGVYQLILSVYVLVSTLSTCGISTAVTRLVTDELVRGSCASLRRLMRFSVFLSIGIGLLCFAGIAAAADPVARFLLRDVRAVPALRILGIGLPFMGTSACLKGYFLARRRISGSSTAQIIEQFCRIGCIWLLLSYFGQGDITRCCACILIGDTAAEIVSCLFMAVCYGKDRRRQSRFLSSFSARRALVRPFAAIAVPLTAGRTLTTLLHTAENLLVPQRLALHSGSREQALSSFGTLKGMALPLLFFPSSLLSAFSTLLIPEMSEAQSRGQRTRVQAVVSRTLHLTLWASIGFAAVFAVLAKPLGQLVYHSDEVGVYLTVLAPLVPAMYTESITDGLLKGLGRQTATLRFCVADSAIRILLTVLLLPHFGMPGFLFVMLVSNLLSSFLNLHHLLSVTKVRLSGWRCILGPTLAAALTGIGFSIISTRCGYRPAGYLHTGLSALCLFGAYLLLTLFLGCIRKEDLIPTVRRHTVSAPAALPPAGFADSPVRRMDAFAPSLSPFAEN